MNIIESEKDRFPIYTKKDGFKNRDKLNTLGQAVYAFFEYLQIGEEAIFRRGDVDRIVISSMDRPGSKGAHKTSGNAIDFYIEPVQLMPYFAGMMAAAYTFNIYLGISQLHIHIDKTFGKINVKGYESEKTPGLVAKITKDNIDWLLKKYLWTSAHFAAYQFKTDTYYYLLNDFPLGKKIDLEKRIIVPDEDWKIKLLKELKKFFTEIFDEYIRKLLFFSFAGISVYLYFKYFRARPVRVVKDESYR